jgi:hypothetical protein
MRFDALVKVGGSLLGTGSPRALVATLVDVARDHRLAVVPGGGALADGVRDLSARHHPGDDAAHWMAILAMDQHAHLLAALSPRASLCSTAEDCAASCAESRLAVLAPYAWLRAADPLPHGWHVTSDSLAAWLAARLQAARLVLLKSLDGVRRGEHIRAEAQPSDAVASGIVDAHLPAALEPGVDCWILNGRRPERLRELLASGRARGTRLRR